MATRRFSPPDSANGERPARSPTPSNPSDSRTRRPTSSSSNPSRRGAKATSSSTVGAKSAASGNWKTSPTLRRSSLFFNVVASTPSTSTSPPAGTSNKFMCRTRVLLPEPVPPTMPNTSPGSTVSETPRSASTSNGVPAA
jgi:hypothetical protein